jgi:glycosyltransferase involved in cell wall biosynthesis
MTSRQAGSIMLICPQLSPTRGLEKASLELASILSRDFEVTVIALRGRPPIANRLAPDAEFHFPDLRGGPISRFFRSRKLLIRHLRGMRADVIIASGIWSALPALLGPRLGFPVVVWEHSLLKWRIENERKIQIMAQLARFAYPRAAQVVCVSDPVAETLARLVPSASITVIGNPIANSKSSWKSHEYVGSDYLLSVGSLNTVKNTQLSIAALAELPDSYRLVIAGDGPAEADLRRLGDQQDVGSRIQFLGHREDIGDLMSDALALLHPAHAETFGYVLIEAAEAHCPVVALDVPVMNRLIPDLVPGILAPSGTPQAFARAIQTVVETSRPSQDDFLEATDKRRSKFAPELIAHDWRRVLFDCVSRAAP